MGKPLYRNQKIELNKPLVLGSQKIQGGDVIFNGTCCVPNNVQEQLEPLTELFREVYNYLDKQPINDEIKVLKGKLEPFKDIL